MRVDVYAIKTLKDTRGHKPRGDRFAIAVQSDDVLLSTVIIALTSTSCTPSAIRPEVDLGDAGLTHVMVDQMRAVDWSRLGEPIAHLSHEDMSVSAFLRVAACRPTGERDISDHGETRESVTKHPAAAAGLGPYPPRTH